MSDKKWYQTGEFEDGYQFGDVFRTIKNAVSGKKENTDKNIEQENSTTAQIPFAAVKDGKLSLDVPAQTFGWKNEAERVAFKAEHPMEYAVTGGVKLDTNILSKNNIQLSIEQQNILKEAQKKDNEIKNKYGSYKNYQKDLKDKMNEAYDNYQEVKKHKDYTIPEQALNVIGGIDMGDKRAREEYIEAAQKYYSTQNVDEENIKSRIKELNNFLDRPMGTVEERKEWKRELSHLNAVKGKVKDFSSYLEYGMASIDAGATKILTRLSATADAIIGQPLYGAMNLLGFKNNYINENKATRDEINNSVDTRLVASAQTVGDKNVIAGNLIGSAIQTVPTVLMAYSTGGASLSASSASLATTATAATNSSAIMVNSTKVIQTMKSLSQNPVYWTSFSMTYGTDYEQALEDSKNPVIATAYAMTNSSISAYVDAGSGVENLASTGRKFYSGNPKALRWWKAVYEEGGEGLVQKTASEFLSRVMYKGKYKDKEEFVSFLKELGYDAAINAFAGGIAGLGQITFEGIINYKSTNELSRLGEVVTNNINSKEVITGLKYYFRKSSNYDLNWIAKNINVNKPNVVQVGQLYQVLCNDINTAINKQTNYTDVKEGLRNVISQAGVDSNVIYSIALPQYFDTVSKLDIDINTAINDMYNIIIDVDVNNSIKGTISQSGVAPFFDKNGDIHTKNTGQKLNPDEVIAGMWENAPNTSKYTKNTDVEKSQLESVENATKNGIIEETVDNDTVVSGEYKYTIKWQNRNIPAWKDGKGHRGSRTKQHNERVNNYELKINPNNNSYFLEHPDGKMVQFEDMKDGVVKDGKLIMKSNSIYFVKEKPAFLNTPILKQAKRQLEAANLASYRVEWLVSNQKAVEQMRQLFNEKDLDIIVIYFPE